MIFKEVRQRFERTCRQIDVNSSLWLKSNLQNICQTCSSEKEKKNVLKGFYLRVGLFTIMRGMGGGWGSWPPDWGGWVGSPDPMGQEI